MNFFYSIFLLVIQLQVIYMVWVGGFSKDFRQTRDQMLRIEKLWSDRFQYFKLQAFYPVADHPNPTLKSIYNLNTFIWVVTNSICAVMRTNKNLKNYIKGGSVS